MSDAAAPPNPWITGADRPDAPFRAVPPRDEMRIGFVGRRGPLFWLALKTGFLTVITLGFYRFWMKTRLRRWYWSAIRPGGHPMEYVGDPFEKLLGFFIAVVVLTFYFGILNLALMFVSFSVFNSSVVGYAASFAGVIPLWFYARYRARRYVLGRTRWRGVRFGLEPGAWGYAGRALMHWAITILSLGVLWPRMTFALEKYRTDRTFFGSARLVQGGRWSMLYRATIPFVLGVGLTVALALWLLVIAPVIPGGWAALKDLPERTVAALSLGGLPQDWQAPQRLWFIPLVLVLLIYGAIHYHWEARRLMADHKRADGITFRSMLRPTRIAVIYVLGNLVAYVTLLLGLALAVFLALATIGGVILEGGMMAELPRWLSFILLAMLYISVLLLWNVLHNVFVTFPIMRHLAKTTSLPDATGLDRISQRQRDAFAEAEGFAEALDLGAAI